MTALLEVRGLTAGYGHSSVLHSLDFSVDAGEVVAILGANGAGKTTTLRALSGLIRNEGDVRFVGSALRGRTDRRAVLGIGHVPEGRGTFAHLTVEENLWVGASRLGTSRRKAAFSKWLSVFPRLAERSNQMAGTLSGGEQQMLALARTLLSEPRLLLLDEPSLGLAPLMVTEIFAQLRSINEQFGTAFLLVEQNANVSLSIADRGYLLESGRIVRAGSAEQLLSDDSLRRAYLGI